MCRSQINPNVIVGVFLPILLFESAFSVDFHIFRRSLGQILLLAVPGVLMSSALFGGFAVFFFSWEWPTAMMFGAILSATDPVAVVALMRDVGASKRLATLIEGESLINDGTAMLLFSLFKGMAFDGDTFSFSKVLLTFARLAGGGAVLGVVSSRLLAFILSHVYNDPIGETVLTLMFAYGTFFFAEYGLTMISHEAHVSGALAVVTFGLDMAYTGKLYISAQSEEALHSFWSLLEWLADSVIFCLTGVIISKVLVYKEETCADGVCTAAEHSITSSDWLNMLALYVHSRLLALSLSLVEHWLSLHRYPVMHIVRAICLAVHWPCVNSQQAGAYQHSRGEFIVLLCSALRGAVGLSLAMEVCPPPPGPPIVL
jgi:NhaP-type Na+/H+ or K+/H+ antiporter